MKQAETQRDAASDAVTARLPETYQWLLVPDQKTPEAPLTWQVIRLSGRAGLAARAAARLRSDDLLIGNFAGSLLRRELDRVPLWRGDRVAVKQLVDDFAQYLYLPRLEAPEVLHRAVADGARLLTWERDGFAFADDYDEAADRYVGLRGDERIALDEAAVAAGVLVKPEVARRQLDAEQPVVGPGPEPEPGPGPGPGPGPSPGRDPGPGPQPDPDPDPGPAQPTRFHGTVQLDTLRAGRSASQIADEVVSHLSGLPRAKVIVTLEIEAEIPDGAPDSVVRTVTENSRTLKFASHGFERE